MCGLFGYVGPVAPPVGVLQTVAREAARRGPHAWGFAWVGLDGKIHARKAAGSLQAHLDQLTDVRALALIGQCRLATSGTPRDPRNNQPLAADDIWVAHNGNVYNEVELTAQHGWTRASANDSEVLALLIADAYAGRTPASLQSSVEVALKQVDPRSPLALLVLSPTHLVAVRRQGSDAPAQPLWLHATPGEGVAFCSRPARGEQLGSPVLVRLDGPQAFGVRKSVDPARYGGLPA